MNKLLTSLTALAMCIAGTAPAAAASADPPVYQDFTFIVEDDGNAAIMGYLGDSADITIPAMIENHTVTKIGICAFEDNLTIKNVTLPDTITEIQYKAFADCRELKTINFPDSLKTIGEYAFTTCHSLESIDLNQVERIGRCSFQLCISLEEITVPGTISTVPDHAFHGCHSVKALTFEEGVTEICSTAVLNAFSLREITIADSVTSIGEHAVGYTYYSPNFTRVDSVIYGSNGSAAEEYAKANGFSFMPTGVELGDLNADLRVDATDAALLLVAAAAKGAGNPSGLSAAQEAAADTDGSGDYNAADATRILQYAAYAGSGGAGSFKEYLSHLV